MFNCRGNCFLTMGVFCIKMCVGNLDLTKNEKKEKKTSITNRRV